MKCCISIFIQVNVFLSFLSDFLFELSSCLSFSFQVFRDFHAIFPWFTPSLIPLWLENTLCMISILLNLLRLVLWPQIWSILVYVPLIPGKNVYYDVLGRVSYKCQWLLMKDFLFSFSITCWEKSVKVTITVDLFIPYFNSNTSCSHILQFYHLVCTHKDCCVFLVNWPLLNQYIMTLFVSGDFLCSEVYLFWYCFSYSCFPLIVFAWYVFFHPFTFNAYQYLK